MSKATWEKNNYKITGEKLKKVKVYPRLGHSRLFDWDKNKIEETQKIKNG